eukprot:CAMPEP_0185528268 /NCGR_PEP_ID=MMETSP1366-20130426/98211_1 /TAXON_ID=38817 /ORGANISM="Gephyrocapsa oceanica, Strain RCC1303" /LENGTH=165 /DNA_ID=CAMNT_0028139797 /DNA_START=84 /DNA_END=578 /DNA_ORIENTATION=-
MQHGPILRPCEAVTPKARLLRVSKRKPCPCAPASAARRAASLSAAQSGLASAAGRAAAIVDGLRGAKPLADGADDVVAPLARRHDELRRRLDAPRPPRQLGSGRLWLRRAAGRASAGLAWAQKGVPAPGRGVTVVVCDHVLPRAARRQVDLAYERRRGAFRAAQG